MDDLEKARLLLRLAGKNPDESQALLAWTDELLAKVPTNGTGRRARAQRTTARQATMFPLPVFIETSDVQARGTLFADGRLQVNGKTYKSPSGAAVAALGYSENGWRAWKFIDEDGSIQSIDVLRSRGLL